MKNELPLSLIDKAYSKRSLHGPNLRQAIKGVTAKQAAWRPAPGAHNIWELTLHAAYWKYVLRRRIQGGKRRSFTLKGSNFFSRPEEANTTEAAWRADRELLENEHRALTEAVRKVLNRRQAGRVHDGICAVALHDVYHAGQIRLLRRLMEK
jgi:DinB superfamily